ncbi:MAG: glycosyltransferase [Bacteroides sp.]|nr:glycosyltransferase [Bacteroides sp.]
MKISIITATFNSSDTLRDTIKSVLAQDYDNWEHIIVDGNSTDNTVDIIREYQPFYKGRLKWISEPDRGIYDAMNKGISMSLGEVIGILNSDDFYTSNDILSIIHQNFLNIDAVYGDVHYVNHHNPTQIVRYYSSADFKRWKMRIGFMPAHPSFYCRREIYSQFGMFDTDFHIAADFEQLLRLIYVNKISIRYIAKDFVTMRTGGASSSGFQSHKRIIMEHLKAYHKNKVKSGISFEAIRYLWRIGEMIKFKILNK